MPEKTTQKAATKKTRTKIKTEERIFLEFKDQIDVTDLITTAKKEFKKLYPDEVIKDIKVYINAIEMNAYYVVNGRAEDAFKFKLK